MALLLSLFLTAMLTTLGLAYLGSRGEQLKSAAADEGAAQSYLLARAGLDRALLRLRRDPGFPPVGRSDQKLFAYSEAISGVAGQRVGTCSVTLDARWSGEPYRVLRIVSVGIAEGGRSRRKLVAEVDVAPTRATFLEVLHILDGGAP
jgi:hypothetical protein